MASILLRFCSNCSHLAVCHSMLGASGSDVEGEGLDAFWRLVDATASDAVGASPAVEGTASGRLIATTSASRIRDAFTCNSPHLPVSPFCLSDLFEVCLCTRRHCIQIHLVRVEFANVKERLLIHEFG
ncbi:hypothetical protein WR25_25923 [Diploscapter pachys]|uniref:Uncharacterized protein n=1 Tax=Diploscapter pachys TaxID=2018661 RepID=A0A2A2KS51_9BILA|nr:hypothetical protein WR25_25923 [Diploscapter pachys]